MTDQTIIDDAVTCGIFSKEHNLVLLTENNMVKKLTKTRSTESIQDSRISYIHKPENSAESKSFTSYLQGA